MNRDKLNGIKEKYEALSERIVRPEVIADNKEWTQIGRASCRERVLRDV